MVLIKYLKNGEGTGYYTTGLAAAFYMKTLVSANSQISQQKTETSSKDTMLLTKIIIIIK